MPITKVISGLIADGAITSDKLADANITTSKLADSNVTTAKLADTSVTSAKLASNAATPAKLGNSGYELGFRNKIINGDMNISQRGTTFIALASNAYCLDRWVLGNTSTAVVTVTQDTDVPSNLEFQNSLKITVTTADASIGAAEGISIAQRIEGFNVRNLIGRPITLSFWVKSSKTGTHCVRFSNDGADRTYVATYTVTVAGAWEYKTITVSAGLITAGTWDWTNGTGIRLGWTLAAGSNYQTTSGAWQTGDYLSTSAQVNCVDTIGNVFSITGVQLEAGSNATPFEFINYGLSAMLCQRYYLKPNAANYYQFFGVVNSSGYATYFLPTTMRATPSAYSVSWSGGTNATPSTIVVNASLVHARLVCASGAAGSDYAATLNVTYLDAELT